MSFLAQAAKHRTQLGAVFNHMGIKQTVCVLHLRPYLVALSTSPPECPHRVWSRNGREGCSGMLHNVITQMVYCWWELDRSFRTLRLRAHKAPLLTNTPKWVWFRSDREGCFERPFGVITQIVYYCTRKKNFVGERIIFFFAFKAFQLVLVCAQSLNIHQE